MLLRDRQLCRIVYGRVVSDAHPTASLPSVVAELCPPSLINQQVRPAGSNLAGFSMSAFF